MAKFNEYPAKTTPKDADKFMLYSAEDAANKLIDYDKLADAVLNKLTSKTFGLDAGTMTLPAALNQLNSNSSIRLCRVVFGENTFSSELKGKTYKAIIGFFHKPSDNPFSFDNGYFIAFQSTYLQEENMFVIIGFGFNGTIENKFLALK